MKIWILRHKFDLIACLVLVAIIGIGTMFSVMQRGDEWNELEQAFA